MTATASQPLRMDLQWPRALNKILTNRWTQLKNTLVLKDFVDHLIQKRVVSLDYWMGLKSKPVTESERTEDFLSLVMKFNREKYSLFLEALLETGHLDLVKDLAVDADGKPKRFRMRQKSKSSTSSERSSEQTGGQTDADPADNSVSLVKKVESESEKAREKQAVTANKSGAIENIAGKHNEDILPKSKTPKAALEHQNKIVERLYYGKATNVQEEGNTDKEIRNHHEGKQDQKEQEKQYFPSQEKDEHGMTKNVSAKDEDGENISNIASESVPARTQGSARSREQILEEREQNILNRETELNKKEQELEEKDKSLQELETNLIIRERSFVLEKQGINSGPSSLPRDMPILNFGRHLMSPAASSTQSSDYLADVRDQIREIRREKAEIEDETSYGPTPKPKEDYVKMKDLEIVQQDIADIKEGIATDRDGRQTLQEKLEEQRETVENLHSKISNLENEKEENEKDFNKKLIQLKTDLKNVKSSQSESMSKVKEEIKAKEEECKKLRAEMDIMKKSSSDLENRVSILETDKTWAENELQRMEKEVASLKQKLDQKEGELSELRTILEETETERDDLIDEVAILKNEIGRLRSDRKRLEHEKKTLLARCVKPGWNQNTRTSSFK